MARMNYNPFHNRTDGPWKLKTVLLGTPDDMGLFDYLSILPIAYKPAIHAANAGNHKKTELALWALTRPLELLKLLTATILTLAAIAVVAVAALVITPFALAIMAGVKFFNWVGSFHGKSKSNFADPFVENQDNERLLPDGAKQSRDYDHSASLPSEKDLLNLDIDNLASNFGANPGEDDHKSLATTLG